MNTPLFSAEVSLFDDADEGLRVECPQTLVEPLAAAISRAGLTPGQPVMAVRGSRRIPNWMEVPVGRGDFDSMKSAVKDWLVASGIQIAEESFSSHGEKHVRLNLKNLSVFK